MLDVHFLGAVPDVAARSKQFTNDMDASTRTRELVKYEREI
jgi:hypothetical protein